MKKGRRLFGLALVAAGTLIQVRHLAGWMWHASL